MDRDVRGMNRLSQSGVPPQQEVDGVCREAGSHRRVSLSASGGASDGGAAATFALFPLSHLMRWRTSEDSSVISPKPLLPRHGTTSSSSSASRTRAQTAIRA